MAVKAEAWHLEPPSAKLNDDEKLVTETSELKTLHENTFKKRLQHREMKPELKNMFELKI